MLKPLLRQIEIEELSLAQKKASIQLTVFVGGPYIDESLTVPPDAEGYGGATLLRYNICRYITDDLGHNVTVGENSRLQKIYKDHLDKLFDASTFEFMHVHDNCDAVVILPSSPGSFCELGYFSANDIICRKMLILRDASHASTPGYVHLGPSIQASNSYSRVEDISYVDLDEAKGVVNRFLGRIVTDKLRSKVRVGGAA